MKIRHYPTKDVMWDRASHNLYGFVISSFYAQAVTLYLQGAVWENVDVGAHIPVWRAINDMSTIKTMEW